MAIAHQLQDEFPGSAPTLGRLAKADYAFGRLVAAYDEVNREIWQIETEQRFAADEVLVNLKKRRLLLRDDIAVWLGRER